MSGLFDRIFHGGRDGEGSADTYENHTYGPLLTHWINVTPMESKDELCQVRRLDVVAHVCGIYAEVTQTITLYNPNRRDISAQLDVPLPDRAVICGYGLEIDGQIVDGVVVPKEEARVIFETEQRRMADPGLVEAVRGNLYSTRVYPVPARGTRSVRLSYMTPLLLAADGSATLDLPMPSTHLEERTMRISVEQLDGPAPVITGLAGATVEQHDYSWSVETTETDLTPDMPVRVAMPELPDSFLLTELDGEGTLWFCASSRESAPAADDAPRITALTVLWDASGSRAGLDHAQELELLRTYAAAESVQTLTLVVFADRVREVRSFATADELVSCVSALRYDGGTDFEALSRGLAELEPACAGMATGSACVLFTDGLDTLALEQFSLPDGCSVVSLVSGMQRDAEALRQGCRGPVLDLSQAPQTAAELAALLVGAGRFGVGDVRGTGLADVCDMSAPAGGRRVVIGKALYSGATLQIGESEPLELSKADAREGSVLSRAWAARRITLLSPRKDENANELLELGKRYGMASPATSLLVLESLSQWLRYDIEPPASWKEMHDAWKEASPGRMRLRTKRQRKREHLEQLKAEWAHLLEWWERDYSAPRADEGTGARVCPRCGAALPQGARFCLSCGSPVQPAGGADMSELFHEYFEEEGLADNVAAPMSAPDSAPMPTSAPYPAHMPESMSRPAQFAGSAPRARVMRAVIDAEEGSDAMGTAAVDGLRRSISAVPEDPSMRVSVKAWMPDAPYLKALDEAAGAGADAARDVYFAQRKDFRMSPSFFLDCAGWFLAHDDASFGVTVLTNLAELRIEDAGLLRVMAWRLREAGMLEMALVALRRVQLLRSEDSQSYRDLALVLSELAREAYADGREQEARAYLMEALSIYKKIALTPWDRRPMAIALFAVEEHNVLKAWAEEQEWSVPVELPSLGAGLTGVLACDLRITLAWDADETDVDIHVTEPTGEEAYYAHNRTFSGGRVSEDITDGFGPELYEVRKAEAGTYLIRAHYFASHQQTVFGPATCTLTVYSDWGRANQTQSVTTMRLDREREMIEVGTASYGAARAEDADAEDAGSPSLRERAGELKLGMGPDEVKALLGDPVAAHTHDTDVLWQWQEENHSWLYVLFTDGALVRVTEISPWGDGTILLT